MTMPWMGQTSDLPLPAVVIHGGVPEALVLPETLRKSTECHLFNGAGGEEEATRSGIGGTARMQLPLNWIQQNFPAVRLRG